MEKKKSANEAQGAIPSPFGVGGSAMDLYHDAMDLLSGGGIENGIRALQLLEKAYKLEPESVEIQTGYIGAYTVLGIHASTRSHIELAYAMTRQAFPKWPKHLEWGFLENRSYLRAIQYRAEQHWDDGEKDLALELYRLLLRLNPNDNQGVRYAVAAIHAGMTGEELEMLWDKVNGEAREGALGRKANDEQKHHLVEDLLNDQNQHHHFWSEPD